MSASYIKNQLLRQNIRVASRSEGEGSIADTDMDNSYLNRRGRGGNSRRPFGGRGGGMHGDGGGRKDNRSVTERLGERYGFKGQRFQRGRGSSGGSGSRRWFGGAASDPDKHTWYRVTVPFGQDAGKDFVLNSLSELLEGGLQPHQFRFERNRAAQFFICTNRAGSDALAALTHRVTMPSGFKMRVFVSPAQEPPVTNSLDDVVIAKMKVTMSNKFNVDFKALDMSDYSSNPELKAQDLYLPINRLNIMAAVVKIIEENIPELVSLNLSRNRLVNLDGLMSLCSKTPNLTCLDLSHNELKSFSELDKIKSWQLVELNISNNPVVSQCKSDALTSAVRKRFPKLLKLNGEVLAPSIGFDVAGRESLPPTLGSTVTCHPKEIQDLLARFLEEYFKIYDSPKRDPLIAAYHEEATFSYAVGTSRCSRGDLGPYFSDSRNLLRLRDEASAVRRKKMLKHGPLPILATLIALPKTSHWLHTFNVDVLHASQSTIILTVKGLFEELPAEEAHSTSPHPCVRAFCRTFVTVPWGSGIVIANEQLTITNASSEQIADATTKRPPSLPPAVSLPTEQVVSLPSEDAKQVMVTEFSAWSGMNRHWSEECLTHNDWNATNAAAMFNDLKAQGKIPSDAFV